MRDREEGVAPLDISNELQGADGLGASRIITKIRSGEIIGQLVIDLDLTSLDQHQFINIACDVKTLVENIQSRNLIQNVRLRVKRSQLSSNEAENAISPYRNNVEII